MSLVSLQSTNCIIVMVLISNRFICVGKVSKPSELLTSREFKNPPYHSNMLFHSLTTLFSSRCKPCMLHLHMPQFPHYSQTCTMLCSKPNFHNLVHRILFNLDHSQSFVHLKPSSDGMCHCILTEQNLCYTIACPKLTSTIACPMCHSLSNHISHSQKNHTT